MKKANQKVFFWKTFVFILLLFIIIGCCIWGLWYFHENGVGGFWTEILTAFLTTLISIIILSLGFQIFTNQQMQWDIQQKIMKSLGGNREIISKYNKDSIKKILYNCFPPLLGNVLGEKFVDNVVVKQIENPSYRKGYDYDVKIKAGGAGKYRVTQTISYRKCIKNNGTRPKYAKFCFAFSEDPFYAFAKDNTTIFFREVINDADTQARIIANAKDDAQIRKILDFHFTIGDQDLTGDVKCEVEKSGVVLTVKIPSRHIIEKKEPKSKKGKDNDGIRNEYANEEEKTFEYEAEMKCAYDSSCKYFYCAFPEPTIGAKFTIRFSGIDIDRVRKASFLSSDNYGIYPDKGQNQICVRTKDKNKENIIFPHSGVVFFWE